MSCRGLIAAVATAAAILSGHARPGPALAPSRQQPDLAGYDRGIAAAVRSDLAASARLPDGGQVYVFGDTLALTGPAGESQWGSATPDPRGRGWWLTGTRDTGGTGCVADCKTMDTAYVPLNAMTHPSAWHVQLGVLPSGDGDDLGTVVSMSHVG